MAGFVSLRADLLAVELLLGGTNMEYGYQLYVAAGFRKHGLLVSQSIATYNFAYFHPKINRTYT